MFRKLITNLSFSPSLIGEVALFAKRLKREKRLRLIGVLAIVVAVILNTITVLYPPESTNTASDHDMIYGGIESTEQLLSKYDTNESNIKDIFEAFSISRNDIASLSAGTITSAHDTAIAASRVSSASQVDGEQKMVYNKASGGSGTLYFSPIKLWNTTAQLIPAQQSYPALVGESAKLGWFAIVKSSGSLAVKNLPKNLVTTTPSPINYSKKVHNDTQKSPGQDAVAHASDRITYTLTAANTTKLAQSASFVERIGDVLEYADIIDTGGGTLDMRAQTLTWSTRTLKPEQSETKQFSVRLKSHLPATARGTSNPYSYDCTLSNTFGTTVHTPVLCPPAKLVETVSSNLPAASHAVNYGFSLILLVSALYFYARARQQEEEVRLIRRDVNEGNLL